MERTKIKKGVRMRSRRERRCNEWMSESRIEEVE